MTAPLRFSLLALFVSAPAALAAQPAPLPAEPQSLMAKIATTSTIVAGLREGRFTAVQCAVEDGRLSCGCLRTEGTRYELWEDGYVEGVVLSVGTARMTARSATFADQTWVLQDVWYVDDGSALHAQYARFDAAGATLDQVTWHDSDARPQLACGAHFEVDQPIATASSLKWTDRGWRIDDYKAGPWPVPLAHSAHRSAPGLLPPLLRTTGEAGSVEAAAALLGGSFATVSAGWNAPVTAGVGLMTSRQGDPRTLRALAAYHDEELAPVVHGDVSVGRQQHIRGHLEHPMTFETWNLRRYETGALLRDWRRSNIGVSGSAGAHSLQVSGSAITDPRQPNNAWAGQLGYGTSFRHGRTRWTLDLQHNSDRLESTRHSTTGVLGVRVPLGSTRRAWVSPGVDLVANYGAVTAARGLDASTTLLALAGLEGGLAFEGRFGGATHLISPQLRLGGELGGLQQRQVREGAPEYPFTRPAGWRWAALTLEQRVQQNGFSLRFPAGVFADIVQDESVADGAGDLAGFVRVQATLDGAASIDGAAVCESQCAKVSFLAGGRIRPTSAVRVGYIVSDLSPRTAALLDADQLLSRGHTALRLAQPDTEGKIAHYATLRLELGAAHGEVFGAYGPVEASRGLGAEFGWHYGAVGWGLTAGGGYAVETSSWAVIAGLSMRR